MDDQSQTFFRRILSFSSFVSQVSSLKHFYIDFLGGFAFFLWLPCLQGEEETLSYFPMGRQQDIKSKERYIKKQLSGF